MKVAAILLVSMAGLWLFGDSLTMTLSPPDPVRGRAKGCYTSIETALDFTRPSDTLRNAQSIVGAALAFVVPFVSVARARWRAIEAVDTPRH